MLLHFAAGPLQWRPTGHKCSQSSLCFLVTMAMYTWIPLWEGKGSPSALKVDMVPSGELSKFWDKLPEGGGWTDTRSAQAFGPVDSLLCGGAGMGRLTAADSPGPEGPSWDSATSREDTVIWGISLFPPIGSTCLGSHGSSQNYPRGKTFEQGYLRTRGRQLQRSLP